MGNTLSDPASNPLVQMLVLGGPNGGQNLAALKGMPAMLQKLGMENETARNTLMQGEGQQSLLSNLGMGGWDPLAQTGKGQKPGIMWDQLTSDPALMHRLGMGGATGTPSTPDGQAAAPAESALPSGLGGLPTGAPGGIAGNAPAASGNGIGGGLGGLASIAPLLPPQIRSLFLPNKNYLIDGKIVKALTDSDVMQLRSQGHMLAEAGPANQPTLGPGQAMNFGPGGTSSVSLLPGVLDALGRSAAATAGGTKSGELPFIGPAAAAQASGTLQGNPGWGAPVPTFDAQGKPITVQTSPGGGVRQPILPGVLTGAPMTGGSGAAGAGGPGGTGGGGTFSDLSPAQKAEQEASTKAAVEKNYALRDQINTQAQQADEDLPLFQGMQAARKIYTGGGYGGELKGDALKALQSVVPQSVLDKMTGGDKAAAFQFIQAGASKLASDLRSPGQRITQQEIMNLYLPAAGGASMSNNAATALFDQRIANAQKWQGLRDTASQYTDESGALKPGFYKAVQSGIVEANKNQQAIMNHIAKNKFNFGSVNVQPNGMPVAGAAEPIASRQAVTDEMRTRGWIK